jgi:hypothetical protein
VILQYHQQQNDSSNTMAEVLFPADPWQKRYNDIARGSQLVRVGWHKIYRYNFAFQIDSIIRHFVQPNYGAF